ncbi:MAG: thermonuclease family protein [Gordonibacter sp.]|uniref:thermonuclease family protein n=1 Tax=Gordonibacter sp. TaxID=1968902 RepID=UPI002FCC2552
MAASKQQMASAFSSLARKSPVAAVVVALALVLALLGSWIWSSVQPVDSASAGSSSSAPSLSSVAAFDGALEEAVVTHVTDGDTIKARLPDGTVNYVRLVGIDTPESVAEDQSRNCEEGVIASNYTKSLVSVGQTIWLQRDVSETDRYGRWLRYVWLEKPDDPTSKDEIGSKMLNAILVREGYAQVKHYSPDTTLYNFFKTLGDEAIAEGKGVTRKWA